MSGVRKYLIDIRGVRKLLTDVSGVTWQNEARRLAHGDVSPRSCADVCDHRKLSITVEIGIDFTVTMPTNVTQ